MITLDTETVVWNLSDLYSSPEDDAIEESLNVVLSEAKSFQELYKEQLESLSESEFLKAFQTYESIYNKLYKVAQFASLSLSVNIQSDFLKKLQARVDDYFRHVSNYLLFFSLECSQLSDQRFLSLSQSSILKNYNYFLKRQKKNAGFKLTEPEEKIVITKNLTGENGYKKLYGELTSAFNFEFELDGAVQVLNGTQLRNLRLHEDPDVRGRAMKLFYSRYEEHQTTISHVFNNLIKDFNLERELRGYDSAIHVRNVVNDLSSKAVQLLHDVTTRSNTLVQKYYKIKSEIINLPDLSLADIYAPMPQSQQFFSYSDSKDIVLKGFAAFDDDFYHYAKVMFDENRIHAPVLKTKQGGAYCSGYTPDTKPYVMLNHLGKARDVATMAHELGHAIHDMFASKQTLINYHPILPLAETASVFCEMIVTDLLLTEAKDPFTKQTILTEKLEDIFATSHRQNMFSCFEMAIHDKVLKGLPSIDEYCELYTNELKTMFGDSVIIPTEYRWEWSTIPHFINVPFYVYAYNFGNLLVMALYQKYKEEGVSFIPKLKTLLSAGSVADPVTLTKAIGVDIESESFWNKSIVYIESLIDELESLRT